MNAGKVSSLGVERDLRRGFEDNHGRVWVRCAPGDSGGTWWNFSDGRRVLCRLKYPHQFNGVELADDGAGHG